MTDSNEDLARELDSLSDKERIKSMLEETHGILTREPLPSAYTAAGFVSRLVGWFYTTLPSDEARLQFEQLIEFEFTMANAYIKEHPDELTKD